MDEKTPKVVRPSRCITGSMQMTSREQDPLSQRIRLEFRKSRFNLNSRSDPSHTASLESLEDRGGIVMNFPFLVLAHAWCIHLFSLHVWYLHGFLKETMCTIYMMSTTQPHFLPSWFPRGNHVYYVPYHAWYPHDHHAQPMLIPHVPFYLNELLG